MTATKLKAILTLVGSALVTASVYLPHPWALVAATVGGLFGGSALIKRTGDLSPAQVTLALQERGDVLPLAKVVDGRVVLK